MIHSLCVNNKTAVIVLKTLGATVQNVSARGLLHSCFNVSPTIHSPIFWKVSFLQDFPQKPSTLLSPFLAKWPKSVMSRKTDKAHVCKSVQWIAYGLEEQEFESRKKKASFLFSKTSRPTVGPTQPHIQLVPELFPWHEVDHSVPPSAEVKNEWSYTPTPAICLQGVDRNKFTFTFFTLLKYTHKATSHMCAICTGRVEEQ